MAVACGCCGEPAREEKHRALGALFPDTLKQPWGGAIRGKPAGVDTPGQARVTPNYV